MDKVKVMEIGKKEIKTMSWLWLIALNIIDIGLTLLAVDLGLVEANNIVYGSEPGYMRLMLIKTMVILCMILFVRRNVKIVKWVTIGMSVIVIWNVAVLILVGMGVII